MEASAVPAAGGGRRLAVDAADLQAQQQGYWNSGALSQSTSARSEASRAGCGAPPAGLLVFTSALLAPPQPALDRNVLTACTIITVVRDSDGSACVGAAATAYGVDGIVTTGVADENGHVCLDGPADIVRRLVVGLMAAREPQ